MRQTSSLRNEQQVRNYSTPPGAGDKKEQKPQTAAQIAREKFEDKSKRNEKRMYTQAEVDQIIDNHIEAVEQLAGFYKNIALVGLVIGMIGGNLLCELFGLGIWA